jgi:hypothetical protein
MSRRKTLMFLGLAAAMVVALAWGAGQGWAQVPDYINDPNYANSPPLRKFINGLPGLGPTKKNNLGQYIPIATPTPPPIQGATITTSG